MYTLTLTVVVPWTLCLLLWSANRATCLITLGDPTPRSQEIGQPGGSVQKTGILSQLRHDDRAEPMTTTRGMDKPPEVAVGTNSTRSPVSKSIKTLNPFMLVAMVVTALLVLLLGFAYVTRRTDAEDQEAATGQQQDASSAARQNGGFEQDVEGLDGSRHLALPPSYDDVVKVPWTIWAAAQRGVFTEGTGTTPPPSYEDARRTFPFPE